MQATFFAGFLQEYQYNPVLIPFPPSNKKPGLNPGFFVGQLIGPDSLRALPFPGSIMPHP